MNYIVTAISYYIGGKPTCCNNGFRLTELFCKTVKHTVNHICSAENDARLQTFYRISGTGGEASENDGKREACPESAFMEISTPGAIVPP